MGPTIFELWVMKTENWVIKKPNPNGLLAIPTILGSVQTWTPPLGFVYKLNFDATVFANTNALGFGAIVCNDKGEVIAELSAKEEKT